MEAELLTSSTVPPFPSHVIVTCKSTQESEQTQCARKREREEAFEWEVSIQ